MPMTRRPHTLPNLGCAAIGSAVIIAIVIVATSPAGHSGQAFGSGIGLVFWASVFVGLCRAAKPFSEWAREQNASYWFCFGAALLLCFSGLVNPDKLTYRALEAYWSCGFYVLEAVAGRTTSEPFLMAIFFWLPLMLVLWAIFLAVLIPILVVVAIFGILESCGVFGPVLTRLFFASILAFALRRFIFPPIERSLRLVWPAAAAMVNDIFIALPEDAPDRFSRTGRIEVRVRRKFELCMAVLATALAIAAYFLNRR